MINMLLMANVSCHVCAKYTIPFEEVGFYGTGKRELLQEERAMLVT